MLAVQLNALFCSGLIVALLWLIGTMVARAWPAIAAALAVEAVPTVSRVASPAPRCALAA